MSLGSTGPRVESTPSEGTSCSTGVTEAVEVTLDGNVRVITEDGMLIDEMRFADAGNTSARHATYA